MDSIWFQPLTSVPEANMINFHSLSKARIPRFENTVLLNNIPVPGIQNWRARKQ